MRSRRTGVLVALLALSLLGSVGTANVWPWCPLDWSGASRIELAQHRAADVTVDAIPFRVGGDALLDYMPRVLVNPLDVVIYRLRGGYHPLSVTATVSALSREELGEARIACVRATRAGEVWSRRPVSHGTSTMADGYPPGASPPVPNEAWRLYVANDGPEWAAGDLIGLELWVELRGQRYVLVYEPFQLMKGL